MDTAPHHAVCAPRTAESTRPATSYVSRLSGFYGVEPPAVRGCCRQAPSRHQLVLQPPAAEPPGTHMVSLFLRGPPKGMKGRLPVAAW